MRDVEYMLGYPPRPKYYWLFCWVVCAPILISVRILYRSLHVYHSFKLKRINFYLAHHTIFWTILAFFLAMVPSCVGYFLFLLCTISAAVRLPHGSVHAPKDQWRCGIPGVRPDDWLDPHLFRHVSHPHLLYLQIHHSGGAAFGGNKKICSYSDLRINFPKCIWLISRLFMHTFSFSFEKWTCIDFIQNMMVWEDIWKKCLPFPFSKENITFIHKLVNVLLIMNQKDDSR